MIVAAGAMDRKALERSHGGHHHIVPVVVARNETVGFLDWQFDVTDKIPWPCGNEPQRNNSVRIVWKQNIPGELFLDEACIGLVLVKRADDVIPIGPRIEPGF